MNRKIIVMLTSLLIVGLASGYGVAFSIYQPRIADLELVMTQTQSELSDVRVQVEALNRSLINTQSMLSGWKDEDQVVASDTWFFLSIAPYENMTHDCYYHVPGCQGEMVNATLAYLIGEVDGPFFMQGTATTGTSGFSDLYLPLNKTFQIEADINGLKGNVTVTTLPDSPTCITTLRVE